MASTATSVGDILSGALLTRAATVILINEYDYKLITDNINIINKYLY